MIRKTLIALAVSGLAAAAHAGTYNFTGHFDSDPSTTISGTFSFDDVTAAGVIAAGDGVEDWVDLTSLTVNFGGQTYTLAQAVPGTAQAEFFLGDLNNLSGANAVFQNIGSTSSTLALNSSWGLSSFAYKLNGVDVGSGSLTISAAVPEPASWALGLAGLAAIGLLMSRRRAS